MTNFLMCIACLATDIKMYTIRNTLLQEVFEKLANVRLDIEDGSPETVCYICYSQLQRCYRFMTMSQTARKVLTELLQDGIQMSQVTVSLTNKTINNFVTTAMEPTSVSYDPYTEDTVMASNVHIKKYLIDNPMTETENIVTESQGIIKPKEESVELIEEMVIEEELIDVKREVMSHEEEFSTEQNVLVKEENYMFKQEKECITIEQNNVIESDKDDNELLTTADQNSELNDKNTVKVKRKYIKKKKNKGIEKKHACHICEMKFNCKAYLIRHLRTHTGERPFVCTNCDKSFAQSSHLIQHMRLHTGEKPYSCNICKNKSFNHRYNFNTHMRKHYGVPSQICDICKAAFHQKGDLKRHIMSHTGEKPYSCETCNAKFSQKGHLTKHVLIHTKERPYTCTICKQEYRKKHELVSHKKMHKKSKPYHCTFDGCSKAFKRINTLTNHFRAHTEVSHDNYNKEFEQTASSDEDTIIHDINQDHQNSNDLVKKEEHLIQVCQESQHKPNIIVEKQEHEVENQNDLQQPDQNEFVIP